MKGFPLQNLVVDHHHTTKRNSRFNLVEALILFLTQADAAMRLESFVFRVQGEPSAMPCNSLPAFLRMAGGSLQKIDLVSWKAGLDAENLSFEYNTQLRNLSLPLMTLLDLVQVLSTVSSKCLIMLDCRTSMAISKPISTKADSWPELQTLDNLFASRMFSPLSLFRFHVRVFYDGGHRWSEASRDNVVESVMQRTPQLCASLKDGVTFDVR